MYFIISENERGSLLCESPSVSAGPCHRYGCTLPGRSGDLNPGSFPQASSCLTSAPDLVPGVAYTKATGMSLVSKSVKLNGSRKGLGRRKMFVDGW